ncbi:crossover junction endodeoxyribonuclease RuvC [Candidatus Babeliales bacterium]|nr:crossover junction endodeoxyribonuclease RuvC [Candidatus Babeliales bacterium]
MKSLTILGIDPGFTVTGYGVLRKQEGKTYLLDYGYLKLKPKDHLSERIGVFYNFFKDKIEAHQVSQLALETPFLGKNVQTFLKLGYLRGALYLLANQHDLALHEFSPREVKQAVTGFGGAQKEQVATMILRLFPNLAKMGTIEKQDVTDALAVCLSGLWQDSRQRLLGR